MLAANPRFMNQGLALYPVHCTASDDFNGQGSARASFTDEELDPGPTETAPWQRYQVLESLGGCGLTRAARAQATLVILFTESRKAMEASKMPRKALMGMGRHGRSLDQYPEISLMSEVFMDPL